MSFDSIIEGDYGQIMELTYIDVDTDAAADISTYDDTITMIFTEVDSGMTTAKTATFVTDGTDGKIKWTTENGFLTAGRWQVRGQVIETATAVLSTELIDFRILS